MLWLRKQQTALHSSPPARPGKSQNPAPLVPTGRTQERKRLAALEEEKQAQKQELEGMASKHLADADTGAMMAKELAPTAGGWARWLLGGGGLACGQRGGLWRDARRRIF